jgi:hypothetical protein
VQAGCHGGDVYPAKPLAKQDAAMHTNANNRTNKTPLAGGPRFRVAGLHYQLKQKQPDEQELVPSARHNERHTGETPVLQLTTNICGLTCPSRPI